MNFGEKHKENLRRYGIITALVIELVVVVVIGFFLGTFLDEKLGTSPVLLAIGVIFGFIGGIYRFFIRTKRFMK